MTYGGYNVHNVQESVESDGWPKDKASTVQQPERILKQRPMRGECR